MKKTIALTLGLFMLLTAVHSQQNDEQKLQAAVSRLENAATARDYIQLAGEFENLAGEQQGKWLPHYYAAYCNARVGWLYQNEGETIEPFAEKADKLINTALSLLDTATQKKELSEVNCVKSMVYRAKVFVNPMTYGRQFGPAASQYIQLARKADPTNSRAVYLEGWEKYSTPKMWGGDKKKAKELLETALQLWNAEQATAGYPHWGKKEIAALLKELK